MKINKTSAQKLWRKVFGDSNTECDYAGRPMFFLDYNDRDSKYGWNIDHILPQDRNGNDDEENLIICNIKTNDEKANKTTFEANGKKFQVKKVDGKYTIISHINNPKIYEDKSIWYKFFEEENEKDFANREIHYEDFQNPKSEYGWDVCLINTQVGPKSNNVCIANIRTIAEKDSRNSFTANNYKFQVHKDEEGDYTFFSPDIIADKYDLDAVLKFVNAEENEISLVYTVLDLSKVRKLRNKELIDDTFLKTTKLIQGLVKDIDTFLRIEITSEIIIVYFETEYQHQNREIMEFNILLNTYKIMIENKCETSIDILSDMIFVPENYKYMDINVLTEVEDSMDFAINNCLGKESESSLYIGERLKSNIDIKQYKMKAYKRCIGDLGNTYNVYECDYVIAKLSDKVKKVS